MTEQSTPRPMIQAPSLPGPHEGYMPGFANDFETEALPGALPQGMNSPQKCNYGLYGEQLRLARPSPRQPARSGRGTYRIRPSVKHYAAATPRSICPYFGKSAPTWTPTFISPWPVPAGIPLPLGDHGPDMR